MTPKKERAKIIDRYVAMRQAARAWVPPSNPHLAELQELEKLILSWYDKSAARATFTADGEKYFLPISARRLVRAVKSKPALFKRLGAERFFEVCDVSIPSFEKELGQDLGKFVSAEYSGARSIREPGLRIAVRAA